MPYAPQGAPAPNMMDDSMPQEESPQQEKQEDSEHEATIRIPKAVLGNDLKPGDKAEVEIVQSAENDYLVKKCSYEEEKQEQEPEPQGQPGPMSDIMQ